MQPFFVAGRFNGGCNEERHTCPGVLQQCIDKLGERDSHDLEMTSPDQTVRIRSHMQLFDILLEMDTPITLHLAQLCLAAEDCFLSIVHVTFAMAQCHSVHDKPFCACQDIVAQGWDMHFRHPMQLKDLASDLNNKSAALKIKTHAGRLDEGLVSTSAQQRHS